MPSSTNALPTSLALVEDDLEYAEYLAQYLGEQGVNVRRYGDSNDLLADRTPYDYGFYLLDLTLPDLDGMEILDKVRAETPARSMAASRTSPFITVASMPMESAVGRDSPLPDI